MHCYRRSLIKEALVSARPAVSPTSRNGGHVVLLVNASGRIAVGRTIPPAYLADICATLCELAQIEPPRHHVLQGESFAGADVDLARFIVS